MKSEDKITQVHVKEIVLTAKFNLTELQYEERFGCDDELLLKSELVPSLIHLVIAQQSYRLKINEVEI